MKLTPTISYGNDFINLPTYGFSSSIDVSNLYPNLLKSSILGNEKNPSFKKSFLNKNSPVELYKKYLKSVKDRTLKANESGNWKDLPWETIPIGDSIMKKWDLNQQLLKR